MKLKDLISVSFFECLLKSQLTEQMSKQDLIICCDSLASALNDFINTLDLESCKFDDREKVRELSLKITQEVLKAIELSSSICEADDEIKGDFILIKIPHDRQQ